MDIKVILFLTCLLAVNGFSLRRRSAQNPYDLSRALDVLERERRRIENQEYLQELLQNQDSLYPYDENQGYLAYKDPYASAGRYSIADILDAYPGLTLSGLTKSMPSAKKSRSVHRRTSKPTLRELESIFGPSSSASKKRDTSLSIHNLPALKEESDIKITESVSHKNKDANTSKNKPTGEEEEKDDDTKQISESEMEKLLSEAEKVDKDEVIKEVKSEKITSKDSEPVKEELKTVFSEEKIDNPEPNKQDSDKMADDTIKDTDTEKQDITRNEPEEGGENFNSERFWKLNDFVNLASGNKKKRGAKRDFGENEQTQKSMIELVSEVEALRDEVSRLKLVEFLEDKENDFLATALKDATLAQLQGTDHYLKGEYGDIERAIQVEELLQTVKSDEEDENGENTEENQSDKIQEAIVAPGAESKLANSDDIVDEGPDTLYPSLRTTEEAEKRDGSKTYQEPSLEDDMGRWYDRPIRGHALTQGEAESVLENLMENYGHDTDKEENVEEPIIAEVPDNSDSESIVADLTPTQQKVLQYELSTNEDEDSEEYCPEAEELNDNCVIADAVGLPIDQEARRLCNRHQTCYNCGSTLGFSMAECDNGFRGDIIALCGNDSKCVLNGAEFLSFIKGYHKFNFDYSRQCDASCIKDFIVGL